MPYKLEWEQPPKDLTPFITIASKLSACTYEVQQNNSSHLVGKIFDSKGKACFLKVYNENKNAATKEQELLLSLPKNTPHAPVISTGTYKNTSYLLMECIEGITLAKLLQKSPSKAPMKEVGKLLGELAKQSTSLLISPRENLYTFIISCLQKELFHTPPFAKLQKGLMDFFTIYREEIPEGNNFVHGDFDPTNILVHKENHEWKVAAFLDFEYSFCGSFLWDVANMARYFPPKTTDFLKGLQESGLSLPVNYELLCDLLNAASLVDLLMRTDLIKQPKKALDIKTLLQAILLRQLPPLEVN